MGEGQKSKEGTEKREGGRAARHVIEFGGTADGESSIVSVWKLHASRSMISIRNRDLAVLKNAYCSRLRPATVNSCGVCRTLLDSVPLLPCKYQYTRTLSTMRCT